jgi:serine/threonine-protein kinase
VFADPRVRHLVDQLLDADATPEDVCAQCPELLPDVRNRWQRVRRLQGELDALFPPDRSVQAEDDAALPKVPGYRVEGLLGRGGMGVVFRAWHHRLNRPVALKMMLAGAYAGPRERERFQREAEAVAGLLHPNVVPVYDVGDADGRPYFTMELVDGGSLAQALTGTPLPVDRAADLVSTLAAAVQAAHAAEIVHRDLKPGNVLLTTDDVPKVSDFGLARRLSDEAGLTQSGVALGTPCYMAPEQAGGTGNSIGPAADVYSLGAILYELLTGRPPFRGETAAETVQQLLTHDAVPPSRLNPRVSRDLETICLKCLRKEPRQRYASAAALAEDLDRFLRGEAIAARPERLPGRLARRVRRRPIVSAAVAAATLAAVALVGGGLRLISERTATKRAADEDLREMVRWLNRSSWPEARAALERARGRLGDRGSAELRRRLDQGARDLDLAARLEAMCLELTPAMMNPPVDQPDRLYDQVFRGAGLGQVGDDPEAVSVRVRDSDIRAALVAALDHWSAVTREPGHRRWVLTVARLADPDPTGWRARARDPAVRENPAALAEVIDTATVADQPPQLLLALGKHLKPDSPERLPFLRRVQRAHPGDFWANLSLGDALLGRFQLAEAIRYYQAAVAIRPQVELGYRRLGFALGTASRIEEGVESDRRAVDIEPGSPGPRFLLAWTLSRLGRHDEAIRHLQVAVRLRPEGARFRTVLGDNLAVRGRYAEALDFYREAAALDPKDPSTRSKVRSILVQLGRGEEARAAWQTALDADPPEHDAWYGYAEFCLFLGREDEHRRARQVLLGKFGAAIDPVVAARTARACLLLPATEDEIRQAAALAERAAAAEPSKYPGIYPSLLFVPGLAEYREGRLDRAIATMRGDASRMYGPAPRLVLAMALHRSGRVGEARKVLAAAVLDSDWSSQVGNPHNWISHVLRREAETLIVPNLPAFLAGEYQPRDNDERLALLGVCQFTNRSLARARLYAAAFAAEPSLAEDHQSARRSRAARAAALVGSARGEDVAGVGEPERARWRQQARQWLRADMAAWNQALDRDPSAARDLLSQVGAWRGDSELAGLFEPAELDKLPPDEREDCLGLSKEIDGLLTRAGGTAPKP